MNVPRSFVFPLALALAVAAHAQDKASPEEAPAIDPQAIVILNRAVDKLAGAKHFSVNAEIWEDTELEEGGRAQFTRVVDIKVRRPDHAQLSVRTATPKRSFYYDGKTFSLLDHQKGYYGSVAAPATIDETLAKLTDDYGVELPIDDLLLTRPFGNGAEKAKAAQNLGIEPVLGVLCQHLAFQTDAIDWQAWVENGPVAVVRKVVITSKLEKGAPQLTAILTGWDFTTELPDFLFTLEPPPEAEKIEFLRTEESTADSKPSK